LINTNCVDNKDSKLKINKKSKSILEEISSFVPQKDKEEISEARAQHIITSAIHLFETLDKNYTPDESEMLKKRFLSSIKGADSERFTRMLERVKTGVVNKDEE